MIEGEFDERTLADMNVALERACELLAKGRDDHETRKFIAERIIRAARSGENTLTALTAAAKVAAVELLSRPTRQSS